MSIRPIPAQNARRWREEARATLALALPLVLTNLAQMAITTTDVVMMGWLGPASLAAGTLGANLFFLVFVAGLGVTVAVAPMLAQEIGRFRHSVRDVRRTVRQGFWVSVALALPSWGVLWHADAILVATGQDQALAEIAGRYVRAMMWGLVAFYGFSVLRSFVAALERPGWALAVTAAAVLLNAFSNWVLMFGNLGAPRLEVVGAGLSSTLANLFMFAGLAAVVSIDRRFRRYHLFGRLWRPDRERFAGLFRIGAPIGAIMLFEVSVFNVAALMAGLFGATVLAAHAIAIQTAAVTFMVPMGIGQAATVRVGLAAGRGDPAGVRRAGWTALAVGVAFMAAAALVMVVAPEAIVALYLGPAADAEVARLAVSFLTMAALFQIADGAQAIGAGALRGLKDTTLPMLFAAVGYWAVGMSLGAWLAFGRGLEGLGLWIGLAAGLGVVAVFMVARWGLLTRPAPLISPA